MMHEGIVLLSVFIAARAVQAARVNELVTDGQDQGYRLQYAILHALLAPSYDQYKEEDAQLLDRFHLQVTPIAPDARDENGQLLRPQLEQALEDVRRGMARLDMGVRHRELIEKYGYGRGLIKDSRGHALQARSTASNIAQASHASAGRLGVILGRVYNGERKSFAPGGSVLTVRAGSTRTGMTAHIKEARGARRAEPPKIKLLASPPPPLDNLAVGARGQQVRRLQDLLHRWTPAWRFPKPGLYDEFTRKAVALFQGIHAQDAQNGGRRIGAETAARLTQLEAGQLPKPTDLRARILDQGRQKIGRPYVKGGMGGGRRHGYDCSGFVKKTYAECGIDTPERCACGIARAARIGSSDLAEKAPKAPLRPGDATLYPRNRKTAPGHNRGHIELYVGGKGKDAVFLGSSRGGVGLHSDSYRRGFIEALTPVATVVPNK